MKLPHIESNHWSIRPAPDLEKGSGFPGLKSFFTPLNPSTRDPFKSMVAGLHRAILYRVAGYL